MNLLNSSFAPGPMISITVNITTQEIASLQAALALLPTGHPAIAVIQALTKLAIPPAPQAPGAPP